MSPGILIAVQAGMLATVIVTFLLIYILRLKKNIRALKALFSQMKDDLGGISLLTHLQESHKQTMAACQKEILAYNPEHDPEDQAIALRCVALSTEIACIEARQSGQITLETALSSYRQVAQQIAQYIGTIRENLKGQAAADYQHKIAELQRQLDALNRKHKTLEDASKRSKQLIDLLEMGPQEQRGKDQVEQSLYTALISLCDSHSEATTVREIIYLYHEAYSDRRNGGMSASAALNSSGSANASSNQDSNAALEVGPQLERLKSIINEQGLLMGELQANLLLLDSSSEREEVEEKADALTQQIQEARDCLKRLELDLEKMKGQMGMPYENDEIMAVIEQFTEESAALVERVHMLSNQNKLLATENEQLRLQVDNSLETEEPMVAGLKARLQQQSDEIIELQANYTKLEQQYLTLYAAEQRAELGLP